MNEERRNISHKWHSHPNTRSWAHRCRQQMIAGGEPLVDPEWVLEGAPGLAPAMLRREAEASVALDRDDDVGTYSVEAGHDEVPAYFAPTLDAKPFFMPVNQIVELDEMLGRLNEVLDGYAVTTSAVIRFDKDGLELAVIWNGEQWGVQVG